MDQIDELIAVLLEPTNSFADRHDAAMQLGGVNNQKVMNALFQIASVTGQIADINEQIIIEACGESLAQIWVTKNDFDKDRYQKLHPYAREEAKAYLKYNKPEWIVE